MKWYDWIPIIGVVTSVYKEVKVNNGFIMLLWFILQIVSTAYLIIFIYLFLDLLLS